MPFGEQGSDGRGIDTAGRKNRLAGGQRQLGVVSDGQRRLNLKRSPDYAVLKGCGKHITECPAQQAAEDAIGLEKRFQTTPS